MREMRHQFNFTLKAIILHKYRWGDSYLFIPNFTDYLGIPDGEYENFARFLKEKHIYMTSKTKLKLNQDHIKVEYYDVLIDWSHDSKAKEYLERLEAK